VRRMAAAPQPDDGIEFFDFDQAAVAWDALYDASDFASIAYYRSRLERTLAWVDDLGLPLGSTVLEIGFGAGRTAMALAERGLHVTGVDTGERMLAVATENVARAGLSASVELGLGDAEQLAAADGSFDLVLALGVIPWLGMPARGVREMGRVTRAGGHVIASINNRRQLNRVLDPRLNPVLEPAKQLALSALRRGGRDPRAARPAPRQDSRRQYDRWLRAAGLEPQRTATLGFGEFSFLGRTLASQATSIRLHERLQARADAGFPLLRSSGAQMLVLSRKRH
jgi:ubiquinone/menaquinone biosynthesis C-methylase UbiE